jgi:uncharacterized protein YxjI
MAGARCPRCGAGIGTGSSFCPYCGAQLGQAMGQPAGPMGQPMGQSMGASYAPQYSQGRIVPQFGGNAYIIDQKILAIRDTFGVKDRNGNLLAYVKQQLVSFGPKFWYEDTSGQRLGEIHGKVLAVRPTYEIYNSQGQLVALVKKKIVSLLGEKWWMEDSSGQEIAKIKGNVWEHDYTIQDTSGQPIAQIHKKWVSVRDSYCVEIYNPSIDPYLVLSYAISLDHTEKKEHH